MPCNEYQFRKVVHDLIDQAHLLRPHRKARTWHTGAREDWHTQFNALRIDGVHQRIADAHLRVVPAIECAEGAHAKRFVLAHHVANPLHAFVGVDRALADKAIRMILQCLTAHITADADHADFHAVSIHFVQRDRNRIGSRALGPVQRLWHVLEHVLNGEIELCRVVLQLVANEVVHFEIVGWEADHSVDNADACLHATCLHATR